MCQHEPILYTPLMRASMNKYYPTVINVLALCASMNEFLSRCVHGSIIRWDYLASYGHKYALPVVEEGYSDVMGWCSSHPELNLVYVGSDKEV